jgi:PAS domain-containing protein
MKDPNFIDFSQFHTNSDMMVLSNLEKESFLDANNNFLKTLEFDNADVIAKDRLGLGFLNIKDRETVESSIVTRSPIENLEIVVRSKSGKVVVGILACRYIQLMGQTCLMTTVTDITQRKYQEVMRQKLQELDLFGICTKLINN